MSADSARESILDQYAVPRETSEKLDLFVAELLRWQRVKNLVGTQDLSRLWPRHIADSLQLVDLVDAGSWLDLGSGAGFPGMIVAICRPNETIDLIEANDRKCAFLRHVARLVAPNARIHAARIETAIADLGSVTTISARALATLDQLLAWSQSLLMTGAVGLFHKGRDHEAELTQASRSWKFEADLIPSRTDSDARIIRVHGFAGRKGE